ncbi:MAG: toll/interleukin-1 receptor domain-containing protein [Anaerolineae bacterium]|nr:toll/interleukin-1 receptor domain-containing protein [Anaerolineae bacterium]
MALIFISYSRKNSAFAQQVAADLEHLGTDVFLDVDDIPAGKRWSDAIQQALDQALVMLVIVTEASMASENVADEWHYFLDNRKPIIPLRLEPSRMPFQLNRLQYVDFHQQDYAQAMQKVVRELHTLGVPVAGLPAPAPTHALPPRLDPAQFRVPLSESRWRAFLREELRALNKAVIAAGLGVLLALCLLGAFVLLNVGDEAPNASPTAPEGVLSSNTVRNAERLITAIGAADGQAILALTCDAGAEALQQPYYERTVVNVNCHVLGQTEQEVGCTFGIEDGGTYQASLIFDDQRRVCGLEWERTDLP